MSKNTTAVLSLAKKASRKRRAGDDEDFEESLESTIEYGATVPKVKNVTSGKDLMDNFGGSTKIYKQHLPDKSAEFKTRNKKFCKATERYAAEKPQRAHVKRVVARALSKILCLHCSIVLLFHCLLSYCSF